jgi:hypothetical protein
VLVVVTVLPTSLVFACFYLGGTFLVCVVFERIESPSVSLIFSHSGGSRAPSITKASGPITSYTGATSATTKAKVRPTRVF